MFKIKENIDLFNEINNYDVIIVGTNTYGMMSQGFQRDVMINYPYVQEKNLTTKYGDKSKIGTILECKDNGNPLFCIAYICIGYNFHPKTKSDYLEYDGLENCLKLINIKYSGKKIATTLIGGSKFDGNGDKDKILDIISKNCDNIDLTIYDYEQKSLKEKLKEFYVKEMSLKGVDENERRKIVTERKKQAENRKKYNGHTKY